MSDTTWITITGRAGTDAEVHVTKSGRELTRFRLGTSPTYRDPSSGEWRQKEAEWFSVKVWGEYRARNVAESVRKGIPLVVQGELSLERWDGPDGVRSDNVITARQVAVAIEHGRVAYTKVVREAGGAGPEPAGASSPAEPGPDEPGSAQPVVEPADPDPWQAA